MGLLLSRFGASIKKRKRQLGRAWSCVNGAVSIVTRGQEMVEKNVPPIHVPTRIFSDYLTTIRVLHKVFMS
jgi:hypothetical protein